MDTRHVPDAIASVDSLSIAPAPAAPRRRKSKEVYDIHLVSGRRKLDPHREPYFVRLGTGRFIGYRKSLTRESWIAKIRTRATGNKNHTHVLGDVGRMTYDEAVAAAQTWFALMERSGGELNSKTTVRQALEAYIDSLRDNKGAEYAAKKLAHVRRIWEQDPEFGAARCVELTQRRIEKWRAGLVTMRGENEGKPLSQSTQNRLMDHVRAALNHVGKHCPMLLKEVRDVKSHRTCNPRAIVLNADERAALIAAAKPGIAELIEGTLRMGCRPGDLPRMRRRDFDSEAQMIRLQTKGADRWVPLPPPALALIERLAAGRGEDDFLFRDPEGNPWGKGSRWTRHIKAAVRAANLPPSVCLYTLRHTFITCSINEGLNVAKIAKLCGTSLRQIQRTYFKLLNKEAREVMRAVNVLGDGERAAGSASNVIAFPASPCAPATPAAAALAQALAKLPRAKLVTALSRVPVQVLSHVLALAEQSRAA